MIDTEPYMYFTSTSIRLKKGGHLWAYTHVPLSRTSCTFMIIACISFPICSKSTSNIHVKEHISLLKSCLL